LDHQSLLLVTVSLIVSQVRSRKDVKRLVRLPWKIYQNDRVWVPPLIKERLDFLNPRKNPFFEHGEAQLFLAQRDGEIAGRISAHIEHLHNQTHEEKTGFFGFFECIDDRAVAHALLDAASEWLHQRGMTVMRGPFSFNINDESGILIEGYEHPPYVMMGHNPPYYPDLLESWGLRKKKDLYCWLAEYSQPMPVVLQKAVQKAQTQSGLTIREIRRRSILRDALPIREIFNSAWRKNWGFVPATKSDILKAAKELKLIMEPKLTLIAETEGLPAGGCIALPNMNEILPALNGRLLPFGIFKLFYRLRRRKYRSTRLFFLGIKEEFRMGQQTLQDGLMAILLKENYERSKVLGIQRVELSWTLEDNEGVNSVLRRLGARHYKTYRIYEKTMT
jgi:hypothetical protein